MAGLCATSCYTRASVILGVTGLLADIVAIAAPSWMHAENQHGSSHSGLWTVCIMDICDQFRHHQLYGKFFFSKNSIFFFIFRFQRALIMNGMIEIVLFYFPNSN